MSDCPLICSRICFFDVQAGRGNDTPPARPSPGGGANDHMVGFSLEGGDPVAAEGDILVLNPRNTAADSASGAGGGVLQMGKQAPRWPDEHGTKGYVVFFCFLFEAPKA